MVASRRAGVSRHMTCRGSVPLLPGPYLLKGGHAWILVILFATFLVFLKKFKMEVVSKCAVPHVDGCGRLRLFFYFRGGVSLVCRNPVCIKQTRGLPLTLRKGFLCSRLLWKAAASGVPAVRQRAGLPPPRSCRDDVCDLMLSLYTCGPVSFRAGLARAVKQEG